MQFHGNCNYRVGLLLLPLQSISMKTESKKYPEMWESCKIPGNFTGTGAQNNNRWMCTKHRNAWLKIKMCDTIFGSADAAAHTGWRARVLNKFRLCACSAKSCISCTSQPPHRKIKRRSWPSDLHVTWIMCKINHMPQRRTNNNTKSKRKQKTQNFRDVKLDTSRFGMLAHTKPEPNQQQQQKKHIQNRNVFRSDFSPKQANNSWRFVCHWVFAFFTFSASSSPARSPRHLIPDSHIYYMFTLHASTHTRGDVPFRFYRFRILLSQSPIHQFIAYMCTS